MEKIQVLKTDGTVTDLTKKPSLEEMQKIVGGYIQVVPLKWTGDYFILNEEGKLKDLPINERATELWTACYGHTDIIVGDVIFCNGTALQEEEEKMRITVYVPSDWAMFTPKGNRAMTKIALELIKELNDADGIVKCKEALARYIKRWRQLVSKKATAEADDTAVREEVYLFFDAVCHQIGFISESLFDNLIGAAFRELEEEKQNGSN